MSNQNGQRLDAIESVALEMLRPGPAHGQLLSPLTPYLALCGDEGPVTLRIELEHWKLMNRLRRLRYVVRDRRQNRFDAVSDPIRESELLELGGEVSRILAGIPTLASELGRAAGRLGAHAASGAGLVHLRLVISGSELSLIPFELVISPQGLPGDGLAMLLQTRVPIIVTREVRRGTPADVHWNRVPRVLFVAAAPGPLEVPQRAHLHALREALDPWVKWAPDAKARLKHVSELMTVLVNASIEDIEKACAHTDYTHVHILAHGDSYEKAGQLQYGVALCSSRDAGRKEVVDGKRLAQALRAPREGGQKRSTPLVVSLATCDSGNVGSVAIPGGSIAHDLHFHGIPWVFGSQFPLTKSGSIRMTRILYDGLLQGEDPRKLLHRLRASMHIAGSTDHDWASLVAYASIPDQFDFHMHWFRSEQMRKAVDVDLDRADKLNEKKDYEGADEAIAEARRQLEVWEKRLPDPDWIQGLSNALQSMADAIRAECYGIFGATEKRAAYLYFVRADQTDLAQAELIHKKENDALVKARTWYQRAMQTGVKDREHWPATQYLSLTAVLDKPAEPETFDGTFTWAEQGLAGSTPTNVAWAHGTLAELELLRLYHNRATIRSRNAVSIIRQRVCEHCKTIVQMMGFESFHVSSTRRQFGRYATWFKREEWQEVADAAVSELTPITSA